MFLYGRGTENRTLINRLKAYYFTVKLYPRHLITLVTSHDRSPFKKLVPRTRIELVMAGYQPTVIPFNYKRKLAEVVGFEPTDPFEPSVFKTAALSHAQPYFHDWYPGRELNPHLNFSF